MELREEVTSLDVEEAVRLLKVATYAACVDPETGLIDMEQLVAGAGAGRRRRVKELDALLRDVCQELANVDMLTADQIRAAMNEKLGNQNEQLMSEVEFNKAMESAHQEGSIIRRGRQVEVRI